MAQAQIVIASVSHVYRPPSGRPVLALEDVSLDVGNREFVALLGPSGCGKSTLLYLIGGFLPTEAGKILLDGAPVGAPGPDRGIVFQHFALFPWKTVRSNILYGLERMRLARAFQAIEDVRAHRLPGKQCKVLEYNAAVRAGRADWRAVEKNLSCLGG